MVGIYCTHHPAHLGAENGKTDQLAKMVRSLAQPPISEVTEHELVSINISNRVQ